MSQRDGGPAFPRATSLDGDGHMQSELQYGMTLRDYFAAKALQGELASQRECNEYISLEDAAFLAEWAFEVADAMLAARSKG